MRAQVPRAATAIWLVPVASGYSLSRQPRPTPPIPAALEMTWTVSDAPGTVWPLLFWTVMVVPPGWRARLAPGNERCESIAATLTALSPDPGELVMYVMLPALPEAATTMTPALARLVEASASADSELP